MPLAHPINSRDSKDNNAEQFAKLLRAAQTCSVVIRASRCSAFLATLMVVLPGCGADVNSSNPWVALGFDAEQPSDVVTAPVDSGDAGSELVDTAVEVAEGADDALSAIFGDAANAIDTATIGFALQRSATSESDALHEVTVQLSMPLAMPASITIMAFSETATRGEDFVFADQTLQFAPGETRQQVAIQLQSDDNAELNEVFSLRITEVFAPAAEVAYQEHRVTIYNTQDL